MTWRDRSGQPVARKTSDDVWPLEFVDRPRPKPQSEKPKLKLVRHP